jgi:hypothetical protein
MIDIGECWQLIRLQSNTHKKSGVKRRFFTFISITFI